MSKEENKNFYYVDQECIACDACVLIAEKHFKIKDEDEEPIAYVCKQPQNTEEIELCEEALEACPVEAIHKDGKKE